MAVDHDLSRAQEIIAEMEGYIDPDEGRQHLIPRRDGDTELPRGGVRGVIPGKWAY